MFVAQSHTVDPLRAVIALDRQVTRARAALQRTSEVDPYFERRVAALVELVDKRDRILNDGRPPSWLPPAA
jgi:hypothetical protein